MQTTKLRPSLEHLQFEGSIARIASSGNTEQLKRFEHGPNKDWEVSWTKELERNRIHVPVMSIQVVEQRRKGVHWQACPGPCFLSVSLDLISPNQGIHSNFEFRRFQAKARQVTGAFCEIDFVQSWRTNGRLDIGNSHVVVLFSPMLDKLQYTISYYLYREWKQESSSGKLLTMQCTTFQVPPVLYHD